VPALLSSLTGVPQGLFRDVGAALALASVELPASLAGQVWSAGGWGNQDGPFHGLASRDIGDGAGHHQAFRQCRLAYF
jgi:hypothetical protein